MAGRLQLLLHCYLQPVPMPVPQLLQRCATCPSVGYVPV